MKPYSIQVISHQQPPEVHPRAYSQFSQQAKMSHERLTKWTLTNETARTTILSEPPLQFLEFKPREAPDPIVGIDGNTSVPQAGQWSLFCNPQRGPAGGKSRPTGQAPKIWNLKTLRLLPSQYLPIPRHTMTLWMTFWTYQNRQLGACYLLTIKMQRHWISRILS